MFTSLCLAHTQFRVLAAAPVDREHHIACIIVNIYDDIRDQCPEQLLATAHGNTRRMPRL
jgi:hypothetical protein